MILACILLLIALLIILIEFFIPGGVLGFIGALLFIGSIISFGLESPSWIYMFAFLIIAIGLVVVEIWWVLKFMQNRKQENATLFLDKDQEGFLAVEYDRDLVGKEGVAASDLKPSGFINVAGKRVQAVSRAGYLEEGTLVKVVGGQGAHLIVKNIV